MTDGMTRIVAHYANTPDKMFFGLLQRFGSIRNECEFAYNLLVKDPIKPIFPIEKCASKVEFWERVRKLPLPQEEKIKAAHALYLIKVIRDGL